MSRPRPRGTSDREAVPVARLLVIFFVVLLGGWALESVFLSRANLVSAVTTYATEIALVTAGQALVMTTAGIDLSVGGIVNLVGVSIGTLSAQGAPTGALIAAGVGIGALCGLVNGLVVTRLRVPPIMVTLATGILFRGMAEGIANGRYYSNFPRGLVQLGQGTWVGLPAQLWVTTVVLLVVGVALGATRYGRWVYALGANPRAARLSGVPTNSTYVAVYLTSGVLSALAGLIMTARLASASPDMGAGLELASITAAVLGGVSVFGGKGTIFGSVLGVITIAALKSALTLQGVASSVQDMGVAVLLLLVLLSSRVTVRSLIRTWHDRADDPVDDLPPTDTEQVRPKESARES